MDSEKPKPVPETRPRKRFARRLWRILRGLVLWGVRVVLLLLLVVVGLVAYLHIAGVPRSVLDSLEDAARANGYPFHIRSLHLRGGHGVVATGVELDLEEDATTPFVQIAEVAMWLNPVERLAGRGWKPTCEITGGRVRATLGGAGDSAPADCAIDGISGRVTLDFGEDTFQLRAFSATAYGLRFQGRGTISHFSVLMAGETDPDEIGGLAALREALENVPEPAGDALRRLRRLEFPAPPEASLYFALDAEHPEDATAEVRLEAARGGRLGLWNFSSFSARARWRAGLLDLRELSLSVGERSLAANAQWSPGTGIARAEVRNTLPPAAILPLLPDDIQDTLNQSLAPLDFPLRVEAVAGPAPIEDLASKLQGSLRLRDVSACGLPVRELDVAFSREGAMWRSPRLRLRMRNGDAIETVTVSDARFDETASTFAARLDALCSPTIVLQLKLPWFAKGSLAEDILSRFEFRQPVSFVGGVRGTLEPLDWHVAGRVAGRDVVLHGETVDSAEAALSITPDEMRITSILMERPEGTARGEVAILFNDEMVQLDADTTFAPRAVCKLLGPYIEEFASYFAMEGPCRSQLRGAVDFHDLTLTSLDGHADGDLLGFGPFVADHASADVAIRGKRVTVTNGKGTLWGGDVSGDFTLYPIPSADVWHFETNARGEKVQLAQVLSHTFENANSDIRGALTFDGHLSGDLFSDSWTDSLVGEADVRVADGMLLRMRLLSGLTFFLPGIDLFSQTDAGGHFRVRDGVVRTDNASISGTLFGVRGEGSYRLDNHLDFVVEVKLLHRGFFASIIQFLTSPLTRLLKFNLTGSLEDPSWSPINLNPMRLVRWATSDSDKNRPARPDAPLPVPEAAPAPAASPAP